MKRSTKMTIGAVMTTLLLSTAGIALAQEGKGGPGKRAPHTPRGMYMQAMPAVDQTMRALRQLDLSEEQKTAIHAAMKAMREEIRPIMEESKTGHQQLAELIKADGYDEKAVAELAKKEGELAAERIIITGRAMSEVYGQLTDDQREKLATMAEQRRERRAERFQQRMKED